MAVVCVCVCFFFALTTWGLEEDLFYLICVFLTVFPVLSCSSEWLVDLTKTSPFQRHSQLEHVT